ncbi:AT-rich interactive domain-containing protein 3A-like [Poecilia reticulata]|uniref:AT-rich interactive domain-containing protein 3A-like n=1 Tax=Poecilia reticulata TaxID=8081 RepID=UPI0007EBE53A|nr:PREDICTED: AT-rich interactive domain-containing protein 3A-like [Poecilia reticulata]
MASKPLPGCCSAPRRLPPQPRYSGFHHPVTGGGGSRLEAVMENLQRQQAARFPVEEKFQQEEKNRTFRSKVQSQIHQQAVAFSHYHGALGVTVAAGAASSTAMTSLHREDKDGNLKPYTGEEVRVTDDQEDSHKDMSNSFQLHEARLSPNGAPVRRLTTDQVSRTDPSALSGSYQDWTYEEQFKQVRVAAGWPVQKRS